MFESLVRAMGVSGAEVIRFALTSLEVDEHGVPLKWEPPAEEVARAG
ncbi:hypothetical protein [Embleya sp. NPDC005971]